MINLNIDGKAVAAGRDGRNSAGEVTIYKFMSGVTYAND